MKNKLNFGIRICVIFACIFFYTSTLADTYFVKPVGGSLQDDGLKLGVFDLISLAIEENHQQLGKSEESANFVLESKLIQLGDKYILTLKKFKNGVSVFADKMEASNRAELDKIITRLVRSIIEQELKQESIRIGEVTDSEQVLMVKRTRNRKYKYTALGPFSFNSNGKPDFHYYFAVGNFWEITPKASIKFIAETTFLGWPVFNENWTMLGALSLGANYYFSPKITSLFIGGDFGYGGVVGENRDTVGGLTVGANIGVAFFRTSATQMSLSLRYLVVLPPGKDEFPYTFGLALGLHH